MLFADKIRQLREDRQLLQRHLAAANTQTLEVLHAHFPRCFNKEGNFDIRY